MKTYILRVPPFFFCALSISYVLLLSCMGSVRLTYNCAWVIDKQPRRKAHFLHFSLGKHRAIWWYCTPYMSCITRAFYYHVIQGNPGLSSLLIITPTTIWYLMLLAGSKGNSLPAFATNDNLAEAVFQWTLWSQHCCCLLSSPSWYGGVRVRDRVRGSWAFAAGLVTGTSGAGITT